MFHICKGYCMEVSVSTEIDRSLTSGVEKTFGNLKEDNLENTTKNEAFNDIFIPCPMALKMFVLYCQLLPFQLY